MPRRVDRSRSSSKSGSGSRRVMRGRTTPTISNTAMPRSARIDNQGRGTSRAPSSEHEEFSEKLKSEKRAKQGHKKSGDFDERIALLESNLETKLDDAPTPTISNTERPRSARMDNQGRGTSRASSSSLEGASEELKSEKKAKQRLEKSGDFDERIALLESRLGQAWPAFGAVDEDIQSVEENSNNAEVIGGENTEATEGNSNNAP